MTSFTQGTMFPTLFATATEEYPDDEVDPVVIEPKLLTAEDKEDTKPLSRWKRSFKNLASTNNTHGDDDVTGDDSVEVDLNASFRSTSSGKGKKHRRRISMNNPFRKRLKTDPTSRDTSGNLSVSDHSTSRFSLSAVPGTKTGRKKKRTSSSSLFSGGSASQKSVSTKKSTSSTAKKLFSSNWMKRRSSAGSETKKDEAPVVNEAATTIAGGLFASAWNMGTKQVADDTVTHGKKKKTSAATTTDQQRASIFGSSETKSARPITFVSSSNQQQRSFLENSLIRPSNSGAQEETQATKQPFGSIRKTLSKAMKKDKSTKKSSNTEASMEEEATDSRFESHDDDESVSSASTSGNSQSTGSQSISSVSEGSNSSDDLSYNGDDIDDDDIVVDNAFPKEDTQRKGWRPSAPEWMSAAVLNGVSDKWNKDSSKDITSQSALNNAHVEPQNEGELNKANSGKMSFRGFRKKKSSEEHNSKTQNDVSELANKMQQTTLRSRNNPLSASQLHDFSHVESAPQNHGSNHKRQASASSLDASIARSVLPKKDDWRSEYKDYISSQNSVGTADKPQGSQTKKKRGAKLRNFIKKSHRRLKSKDGRQQTDAEAKHTRQKSDADEILNDLEGGFPMLLDTDSTSFHRRRRSYSKSQILHTEKDASTDSTGPVVSESAVETSDQSNVFLVRVQF